MINKCTYPISVQNLPVLINNHQKQPKDSILGEVKLNVARHRSRGGEKGFALCLKVRHIQDTATTQAII